MGPGESDLSGLGGKALVQGQFSFRPRKLWVLSYDSKSSDAGTPETWRRSATIIIFIPTPTPQLLTNKLKGKETNPVFTNKTVDRNP